MTQPVTTPEEVKELSDSVPIFGIRTGHGLDGDGRLVDAICFELVLTPEGTPDEERKATPTYDIPLDKIPALISLLITAWQQGNERNAATLAAEPAPEVEA